MTSLPLLADTSDLRGFRLWLKDNIPRNPQTTSMARAKPQQVTGGKMDGLVGVNQWIRLLSRIWAYTKNSATVEQMGRVGRWTWMLVDEWLGNDQPFYRSSGHALRPLPPPPPFSIQPGKADSQRLFSVASGRQELARPVNSRVGRLAYPWSIAEMGSPKAE